MKTKNNLKVIFLVIIFGIITQTRMYSQWKPKTLKVSLVSESVSIPFGQFVINPFHPGIVIGSDLLIKDQTKWYKSLGVDIGYYYHRLFEHAIMIDATYKFGYTFDFGLRPNIQTKLGYKHSILAGETFKFENGEYISKQHPGKPQVNFKIGFGLEYPVTEKISITTDYLGMLAMPYTPNQGKPFALHTLFQLGTIINL